jgi:hypothetical protein
MPDAATWESMAAHVDQLFAERCRALGWPEADIARIERASAVDQQTAEEIMAAAKLLRG